MMKAEDLRQILVTQINKSHEVIRARREASLICQLWLEKWQKENRPGSFSFSSFVCFGINSETLACLFH